MTMLSFRLAPSERRGQRVSGRRSSSMLHGPRRGIAPIVAAAAVSALRTGFGILGAKKKGDQSRNLIYDAYARGRPRLDLHQQDVRQSELEGLVARGLTGGGGVTDAGAVQPQEAVDQKPKNAGIVKTMLANGTASPSAFMAAQRTSGPLMTGQTTAVNDARTLGQQGVSDLRREQVLEQDDLLAQRNAAVKNTRLNQNQDVINSIGAGLQSGAQAYGAASEYNAGKAIGAAGDVAQGIAGSMLPGAAGAAQMSPIQGAMGVNNPANWFGGIVGTDPLGAPGSSWFAPPTPPADVPHEGSFIGEGQQNVHFNVGGG